MNISAKDLQKLLTAMGGAKNVARQLQKSLALHRLRIKEKTEKGTKDDFHYAQAEEVVYHSHRLTTLYVDVVYKGQRYEKVEVTWGPLDADHKKSTVLIREENGEYTKLWFFDREIRTG